MEVNGYPNYLIYDDGRLYSKARNTTSGRYLKTGKMTSGYLFYVLCQNGKTKQNSVHRLVAIHYIPNPNNYPEVDHIDGDKTNNHFSNLRWCSHSQNSNNKGVQSNNKLGIKNIRRCGNSFQFIKKVGNKYHTKAFKTLEEAIQYKDVFYSTLDNDFCKK